jgi:hypothetical protein
MRSLLRLVTAIILLTGCVVPCPDKVTGGHQFSSEALAFLGSPDTTREEVIANLGPPLVEVPDSGVLLYAWQKTERGLFILPDHIEHGNVLLGTSMKSGNKHQWGLFIGYNDRRLVVAHHVGKIATYGLEAACIRWSERKRIRSL